MKANAGGYQGLSQNWLQNKKINAPHIKNKRLFWHFGPLVPFVYF